MSALIQNGALICPEGHAQADLRIVGEKTRRSAPVFPQGTAGSSTFRGRQPLAGHRGGAVEEGRGRFVRRGLPRFWR